MASAVSTGTFLTVFGSLGPKLGPKENPGTRGTGVAVG
jgi:hypothetical protein